MDYKKILTIQDISCVGQCSLTVALPILSACGVETCILPSAVLSTHTGGFKGYTFRDLTDDIPKIRQHWEKEGIRFEAIYTGYLGSAKQIAYVEDIMTSLGTDHCVSIVDPAMADNGKLYPGFDAEFVEHMKSLAFRADYILPNITEACLLTGMEYPQEYDEPFVDLLLEKLTRSGAENVILTGVGYSPERTGVVVYENGRKQYYEHKKIAKGCHGTGDVFASAFTGALVTGKEAMEAATIAADYTVLCIENTQHDPAHWYGVNFEPVLPELMKMIRK